jgi:tetratricopeptide (TPR) repeat protein
MKTLYDVLGALADDDAESIRTAFRKAVKANHPDINPSDPDAALRFRQIVRANAILSDAEQREAYDRVLALALRRLDAKPKPTPRSHKIPKRVADAITAVFLSVVSIGGYMLFEHMVAASAVPAAAVEGPERRPAEIAAVTPAVRSDPTGTTGPDEPHDRPESAQVPTPAAMVPSDAAPPANPASALAIANIGPASDHSVNDAKSYREWGILAYRAGDVSRAIVNFDLAVRLDPSLADASIDRGIVLHPIHKFGRAVADIAQAKRIANAKRIRIALPAPPKTSLASGTNLGGTPTSP